MNVLRWIAILPAAVLGWYAAFIPGLMLYSAIESFCPEAQMISEMCRAPWFGTVEVTLISLGTGLAAFLVVLFAALVAPARRVGVAWGVYGVGCMTALYMAWEISVILELIAAILGGLGAVALMIRLVSAKPSAT